MTAGALWLRRVHCSRPRLTNRNADGHLTTKRRMTVTCNAGASHGPKVGERQAGWVEPGVL